MTKMTAQAKRFEALKAFSNVLLTEDGALREGVTRESVIEGILKLEKLGRTEKWQESLRQWADMVSDESFDLHFAIVQGSMFPVWANA